MIATTNKLKFSTSHSLPVKLKTQKQPVMSQEGTVLTEASL